MLQFAEFAGMVLVSSTVAAIILGLIVELIIKHTPPATRIASDPKLVHHIIRSIEDLDSDNTITLDQLSIVVRRARTKHTDAS
jgi:hypothetical protein